MWNSLRLCASLCVLLFVVSACGFAQVSKEEKQLEEGAAKLLEEKQYDKAIELVTDVLKIGVKNPAPFLGTRAMAWESKGEYEIAIKDYDEIIKLAPKFAIGYEFRARCYIKLRKYDKSISDCNDAIALDSKRATAWLFRGIAKSANGDKQGGKKDVDKALELDPKVIERNGMKKI